VARLTIIDGFKPGQRKHEVAVVAFDGFVPFDLATPLEIFDRVRLPDGVAPYRVRVCGVARSIKTPMFTLSTHWGLGLLARADTIVVPGILDLDKPPPDILLNALRRAARRGARIASICTGAFVLAAAGVLRGKSATTHWLAAHELARRHPDVRVDVNALYIDQVSVLTSAGAAAGIDLCLHIVRKDFGASVASCVAKASVVPLERPGGQSQYVLRRPAADDPSSLVHVLRWIDENVDSDLSLARIAKQAKMSTRSLSRQFIAQVGATPLRWVAQARVKRAQELLETTNLPIEQIATDSGFGSSSTFRERFRSIVGTSPLAYRKDFSQQS